MSDLLSIFSSDPVVSKKELVSLNLGINKRTGEKFAKATTSDGMSYIKNFSKTGVAIDSHIEIPSYSSKEQRNEIIKELYDKNFNQSDIADMLNISQSTVSNCLRKNK